MTEQERVLRLGVLFKEGNEMLRSLAQVVNRRGDRTGWENLKKRLDAVLLDQHKFMYPEMYDEHGNMRK